MAVQHVEHFDYVIIGAGSAGCILANRLSADPTTRVLLIEAGDNDRSIWTRIPIGYMYMIGHPGFDWCFETQPEPQLKGRKIAQPRGKVLGGSSSINGMIQIRGQAADFDHWRQLGLEGWGWDSVLPYFKRHEDFALGADNFHAVGGELGVSPQRVNWPILDAVRRAAVEDGVDETNDFNTGAGEGVGPYHVIQRNGVRSRAARAFLRPARNRRNLRLETNAMASRILFEGRRAVGIEYRQRGALRQVRARREVIIAAGSIKTPQLLMLSGIGPGAHLAEHGISVLADRAGVGANLQDHLQMLLTYRLEGTHTLNQRYNAPFGRVGIALEYALLRRGPMAMGPSPLGIFLRSDQDRDRANLAFTVLPFSRVAPGMKSNFHPFPAITMSVYTCRPTSRGTVRLKNADVTASPELRFNYLSTPEDRELAIASIRITRRLMGRKALAAYRPVEIRPGPQVGDGDDALLEAFRTHATTIFHPVGTARMGSVHDGNAVVDARLRVIGLDGLRVIDASVMPTITSGNTNAPTMMIAEKGAAMVLDDAKVTRPALAIAS
ncbi:MAG: GMC family oxidoreductase N-terminal domain-containing protein [Xanthobacteraceae bacterium]|nr:GMC family oxidoreductase N-terminal domain-containing protein [Xanthobacteraceae bacterium]